MGGNGSKNCAAVLNEARNELLGVGWKRGGGGSVRGTRAEKGETRRHSALDKISHCVPRGQNGISPGQKLKLLQGRREIVGNRADDISQTISIRVWRGGEGAPIGNR